MLIGDFRLFEKLWIYNCKGDQIFTAPHDDLIGQIDYFFKSIRNFANEIQDSFHNGTIQLEKRTFSIIQVNLQEFFENVGLFWGIRRSYLNRFKDCEENLTFTFISMSFEDSKIPRDDMIDALDRIVHLFFKLKIDFSKLVCSNLENVCQDTNNDVLNSFKQKLRSMISIPVEGN